MGRVLFAVLIGAFGCAKDRTLDDYNREKAQKNLAIYKSVEGTYTGLVRAPKTSAVIGAIRLELSADTLSNPTTDGSIGTVTPVLKTTATFQDTRELQVSGTNGKYDPDSGLFQANIMIVTGTPTAGAPAPSQTISITANIQDGHLVGLIRALNFDEDYAYAIDLQLGGDNIRKLAAQNGFKPDSNKTRKKVQVTAFTGQTKFLNGPSKPVRVIILQPLTGGPPDFADIFVPIKTVQATFNYDKSAHIQAANATWNLQNGELAGTTLISRTLTSDTGSSTTETTTVSVDCSIAPDANGNSAMECNHLNTDQGTVAETSATLDLEPDLSTDPPDTTGTADSQYHSFKGRAHFDPSDPKQGRIVYLNVTYPARTLLDDLYNLFLANTEQFLEVTAYWSDLTQSQFTSAKWNGVSGRLDAINTKSAIANYVPEIHCAGFYFLNTKKPFTCVFNSNRTGPITMYLQP